MSPKFITGLLLGAAAGAAVALFVSSDKGKKTLAKAKDAVDDLANNIKDKADCFEEQINSLVEKGKSLVTDLQAKAHEATS
jgi:gas vesicle protein